MIANTTYVSGIGLVEFDQIYCPSEEVRYQMSDGSWSVEGSDEIALTAKHTASKTWNQTVDTVCVDRNGKGQRVYQCTDGISKADRKAWHKAHHAIAKRGYHANKLRDEATRFWHVKDVRLYDGVHAVGCTIIEHPDFARPQLITVEGYY